MSVISYAKAKPSALSHVWGNVVTKRRNTFTHTIYTFARWHDYVCCVRAALLVSDFNTTYWLVVTTSETDSSTLSSSGFELDGFGLLFCTFWNCCNFSSDNALDFTIGLSASTFIGVGLDVSGPRLAGLVSSPFAVVVLTSLRRRCSYTYHHRKNLEIKEGFTQKYTHSI